MDVSVEERKVAIEAIATLANVKDTMCHRILKPAGIPHEVYLPLLKEHHFTGRLLSKRELAPLILDAVKDQDNYSTIVRAIVEIAAKWNDFHLAQDEYAARATVEKASEVLRRIKAMDEEEAKKGEKRKQEEQARIERERTKQSALLCMMFDDLVKAEDAHKRGFQLQELLKLTFDLHQINVQKSFTRNEGGEQIDGAFLLDNRHFLVECRWREKPADIRQIDGLKGQIDRSGALTMGLFLSINGWSENVCSLLKQNSQKTIILMDGYDLRGVLCSQIDLQDFLRVKVDKLSYYAEPFLGLQQYLKKGENKQRSSS